MMLIHGKDTETLSRGTAHVIYRITSHKKTIAEKQIGVLNPFLSNGVPGQIFTLVPVAIDL
jgi:hypothetical protein